MQYVYRLYKIKSPVCSSEHRLVKFLCALKYNIIRSTIIDFPVTFVLFIIRNLQFLKFLTQEYYLLGRFKIQMEFDVCIMV